MIPQCLIECNAHPTAIVQTVLCDITVDLSVFRLELKLMDIKDVFITYIVQTVSSFTNPTTVKSVKAN